MKRKVFINDKIDKKRKMKHFKNFVQSFKELGYDYEILNTKDYGVHRKNIVILRLNLPIIDKRRAETD